MHENKIPLRLVSHLSQYKLIEFIGYKAKNQDNMDLLNKAEKLQYDTSNLNIMQDDYALRMERFKSEIERNANSTYFMQDTCQLYQIKKSKSDPKIENSEKYEEDSEMDKKPEDKMKCSVDDSNQNKPRVLLKKDRLKLKYMEALKLDENLEARVKHSALESNPHLEEQQAELRKRHKDQVERHKDVQEEIMVCFKRDMDELMQQYEAECSRLRKVHSGWMNQGKEPSDNSNTHQP
ncbi:uncharacterized protein Dyak_GE24078, isoform A [Drosophila yakuba]|uniref:Uncharacterized protein, isoform A n=2 Tax=Drosophila yakuba TaxID=7245 RepID=B4PKW6_DROYA|nr:uncharacterized protein Dyak_GE24078, isoform A [Drosophila yakuba]